MNRSIVGLGLTLLSCLGPEYVRAQELLEMVDPAREQALEEYNATFLKEQTYFAARYRIVKANVDALLQKQDVAITPFSDMAPIGLVFDRLDRDTFWKGFYQNDPIYVATGDRLLLVTISMFAYDVDESGTAVHVAQNEGTFFAVSAVLDVLGDSKYVLMPLKYTPKYSVIYEVRRDTMMPIRIDVMPGDPPLSAEEQTVLKEYVDFLDGLPDETTKKVVGDVW